MRRPASTDPDRQSPLKLTLDLSNLRRKLRSTASFDEGRLGAFEAKGVIQDSIHGFIPINAGEYWLLQTPFLRRLHGIKQLGMAYLVFPSARHSRLEHSLGVMHLASLIANKVVHLARKDPRLHSALFTREGAEPEEALVQVARLAGLLHDIGHLAYSHMTEEAVKDLARFSEGDAASRELFGELSFLGAGTLKVHEAYTQAFIEMLIRTASESLAGGPLAELPQFLEAARASLVRAPSSKGGVGDLQELGLRAEALRLIHDIVSNEIADADRLDYLQRDAQATGIVYGQIDADRLVHGITVEVSDDEPVLSLDIKSMQTLEDIFDARYKMYRSVYFHHKVIAFTKAVSAFIRSVAGEWATNLMPLYGGQSLYQVLMPSRLARAIIEDRYYLDDSELDYMIKVYAAVGKSSRRWALSLLERRDLLPISIVKRSEELIIMAEEVLRSHGVGETPDNIAGLLRLVVNRLTEIEDSVRTMFGDGVRLDGFVGEVISPEKMNRGGIKVFGWRESLYLRGLAEEGKIPVLLIYAYSDDERTHACVLRGRVDELRRRARDEIRRVMEDSVQQLRG